MEPSQAKLLEAFKEKGKREALRELIRILTASGKTSFGWPFIVLAAMTGQLEAARLLLSEGADANAKDPNGKTALYFTATNATDLKGKAGAGGRTEMLALLLEYGANPFVQVHGKTVRSCAIWKYGNREVVELLNAAMAVGPAAEATAAKAEAMAAEEYVAEEVAREGAAAEKKAKAKEKTKEKTKPGAEASSSSATSGKPLAGKILCFTGTLTTPRADAAAQATAAGGAVTASVTGKTTHLVAGPGAGAKVAAAQAKGVAIWTEDEFFAAIAGGGGDKAQSKGKSKRAAKEPEEAAKPPAKAAKARA